MAIRLDSAYVKPRINLGRLYDENGLYDKALDQLLVAYKVEPNSLEVNNNLGNVYLHKELYKDAILHYRKAIEKKPNATLMRYNLAIAHIETEDFEAAKQALTDLIRIDATYWVAYDKLGHILYSEGDKKGAKALFSLLLEKNPDYENREELEKIIEAAG
jgi:tetratricopeptide (TPR) repeat protein